MVRVSFDRRVEELRQSGLDSFTTDEIGELFGIGEAGAGHFTRNANIKGVLHAIAREGSRIRWGWSNGANGETIKPAHNDDTFPQVAIDGLGDTISVKDLYKIFGKDEGDRIIQTVAAAKFKPIPVNEEWVQFALRVVANSIPPGKQSTRLPSVFRRFLQDDKVARARFVKWANGDSWKV